MTGKTSDRSYLVRHPRFLVLKTSISIAAWMVAPFMCCALLRRQHARTKRDSRRFTRTAYARGRPRSHCCLVCKYPLLTQPKNDVHSCVRTSASSSASGHCVRRAFFHYVPFRPLVFGHGARRTAGVPNRNVRRAMHNVVTRLLHRIHHNSPDDSTDSRSINMES